MPRSYTVFRRRPGVADILIPKRVGIKAYRFSASATLNGSFTAFQVVPATGFRAPADGSIPAPLFREALGNTFKGYTRFLFNPETYTSSVAAVRDDVAFFMRIESQNLDGSFNAAEAIHYFIPFRNNVGNYPVVLNGTAPAAATPADSLEIVLPSTMFDSEITNDGSSPLGITFFKDEVGTEEYSIGPNSTLDTTFTSFNRIFVRGDTLFKMLMTADNNAGGY